MVKRIKLMAEYNYYPLWEMDDVGDIDPSDLRLSDETIERLLQWAKIYDGIINWDEPYLAGFASEKERIAFEGEGISLWQQLQKELGDEYKIFYMSELQNRLLSHLDEAILMASTPKGETA